MRVELRVMARVGSLNNWARVIDEPLLEDLKRLVSSTLGRVRSAPRRLRVVLACESQTYGSWMRRWVVSVRWSVHDKVPSPLSGPCFSIRKTQQQQQISVHSEVSLPKQRWGGGVVRRVGEVVKWQVSRVWCGGMPSPPFSPPRAPPAAATVSPTYLSTRLPERTDSCGGTP